MLETIFIFLAVLAIASVTISISLLCVRFLSNHKIENWSLKRVSLEENTRNDFKNWRILGFVLIVMSAGYSIVTHSADPDFLSLPIYFKIGLFLLGTGIIVFTNYREHKFQHRPKTDFIINDKGEVKAVSNKK